MRKIVLPEFQEYLSSKSLVNEKYIPFYAHWASKFLAFSTSNNNLSRTLQIQKFIDYLKSHEKIADWQVKQADNAVTLYLNQFQGKKDVSIAASDHKIKLPSSNADVLDKMREALRIKHYAYDTEIVYMDWAGKFSRYIKHIKNKELSGNLGSADVREYLSHLALKRKVSSSTQNQAFNALIFLFRHVLEVELQNLNKTVRAKRGQKLPVVFTVDEVKVLCNQITSSETLQTSHQKPPVF